jgi:hypothetical protein
LKADTIAAATPTFKPDWATTCSISMKGRKILCFRCMVQQYRKTNSSQGAYQNTVFCVPSKFGGQRQQTGIVLLMLLFFVQGDGRATLTRKPR